MNEVTVFSGIHKNPDTQFVCPVNEFRILVGEFQQARQPNVFQKISVSRAVTVQDRPP